MKSINRFLVWLTATLFVLYSFCLNTAAAVFAPAIKQSLQTNDVGTAIATGAFILGFACMQIPGGYLLDRYNPRWIVSGSVLTLAIGNLLIVQTHSLILYTIANFIQGIGGSIAFIAAAVLISQWFSAKNFPIFLGLTQTISCVMTGVIHYYFTLELADNSWQELYSKLGTFGCILFLLSLVFIKSPTEWREGKAMSLMSSLRRILVNKQLWLCSIAAATSFGTLLAYAGYWYIEIEQYYSVENVEAAMISSIIFAGIGIGTPLLGYLANLCQSRLVVIHTALCLGLMMLLLGIYLPRIDVSDLFIIKIVAFLIGFLLSGSILFYTMANEMTPASYRGIAISLLNTIVFIFNSAMLFIPYLFITAESQTFFTYLWVIPFSITISIMLLFFIHETFNQHHD